MRSKKQLKQMKKQKKTESKPAVEIKGLSVDYAVSKGDKVHALREINLEIEKGESVAVVGESGCGKSTLAASMLSLLPENASVEGSVTLNSHLITGMSNKELERIRGVEAGIIFQEPAASLNPVFTAGEQITETITAHYKDINRKEARKEALKLLNEAGIRDAERVYESYPHMLSGGLQQRVMTAIALSCDPEILIADEPTTALDVTVQAQIINLLKNLKKKRKLTLVLITHDLHLALELADRIIVMYAGEVVEDGVIKNVKTAGHPYTAALFKIIPELKSRKKEFNVISGSVPDLKFVRDECGFAGRCPRERPGCRQSHPELEVKNKKRIRCFYPL